MTSQTTWLKIRLLFSPTCLFNDDWLEASFPWYHPSSGESQGDEQPRGGPVVVAGTETGMFWSVHWFWKLVLLSYTQQFSHSLMAKVSPTYLYMGRKYSPTMCLKREKTKTCEQANHLKRFFYCYRSNGIDRYKFYLKGKIIFWGDPIRIPTLSN